MSYPLFLISGPSGSGKTTIMRSFASLSEIVSFTTRAPRPGEVDGVDYHFIKRDEFRSLRQHDGLVEWSQYGDNYYGVRMDEMGKLAISPCYFICDVNGMQQMRELYDRTVSIFIYTETDSAAVNLRSRGENDDFITKRLSTYHEEMTNRGAYDYVVRNNPGQLDNTIDIVRHIIWAEV